MEFVGSWLHGMQNRAAPALHGESAPAVPLRHRRTIVPLLLVAAGQARADLPSRPMDLRAREGGVRGHTLGFHALRAAFRGTGTLQAAKYRAGAATGSASVGIGACGRRDEQQPLRRPLRGCERLPAGDCFFQVGSGGVRYTNLGG